MHLTSAGLPSASGSACADLRTLDAWFTSLALAAGACEFEAPPLIAVQDLQSVGYFGAFPHHVNLVAPINKPTLQRIAADSKRTSSIPKDKNLDHPQHAFTPAACYLLYPRQRGRKLDHDELWTLVSSCCRNEEMYQAGIRQQVFRMREIVFLGQAESALKFVTLWRERISSLLKEIGLQCTVEVATDPFFRDDDPRRPMQKLQQNKLEFRWRGELAVASLNFHNNFFGEAFDIKEAEGRPAFSACVAFGLERWAFACREQFGSNWIHRFHPENEQV